MSLKVLHIYKTYYPDTRGGIERFIATLSGELESKGVRSSLLTTSPLADEPRTEVGSALSVMRARTSFTIASTPFSWAALKKFGELVAGHDLIHAHFPWPFGDMLYAWARPQKPLIVSYHSDIVAQRFLNMPYTPLRDFFLGRARAIVAASPAYARTSTVLQKNAPRVHVIPYGLTDQAPRSVDPGKLHHWQSIAGEGFMLFIGVLRYYKGLHTLIEAAWNAPYRVVIAGDGPLRASLEHQARERGCTNVLFTGHIEEDDKSALLGLCRAFVFPSHLRSEAFGISLIEAAMFGRPMVSCEIGTGTSFVNLNDETGIVIEPENPVALRMAMDRLHHDQAHAEALGSGARRRYDSLFTAARMGDSYLELYHQILSQD